jgi:hypothetical protein
VKSPPVISSVPVILLQFGTPAKSLLVRTTTLRLHGSGPDPVHVAPSAERKNWQGQAWVTGNETAAKADREMVELALKHTPRVLKMRMGPLARAVSWLKLVRVISLDRMEMAKGKLINVGITSLSMVVPSVAMMCTVDVSGASPACTLRRDTKSLMWSAVLFKMKSAPWMVRIAPRLARYMLVVRKRLSSTRGPIHCVQPRAPMARNVVRELMMDSERHMRLGRGKLQVGQKLVTEAGIVADTNDMMSWPKRKDAVIADTV